MGTLTERNPCSSAITPTAVRFFREPPLCFRLKHGDGFHQLPERGDAGKIMNRPAAFLK